MKKLLLWLFSRLGVVVLVLLALGLGYLLRGWLAPAPLAEPAAEEQTQSEAEVVTRWWTCSMHPQIHQPKPGRCPICGMDLIPVSQGEEQESASPRRLVVSEAARKLAEIETMPVERKFVAAEIRMVGKVDYDETRLKHIAAWVPGRLDRLYVDYTGVSVRKGDHLVYLYSPDLLAAQEELLQAIKAVEEVKRSKLELMRETAEAFVHNAREKLRLWGLTPAQIAEVEERGRPTDHLTIYAPVGGVVIHKNATEGMYVNTGTRIYTIADLSRMWVRLDAYESDMMWIRYGQPVEFSAEAYPGEVFRGRIAFVDPVLNEKTRTVKLRVNVENPAGKLKPGMFVRAVVRSQVAAAGGVMDPDLAGKWICPMHPDVVKPEAGQCDLCGMPLARTESLGYVSADRKAEPPLVIPASAPLITGKRAVVYVEVPDAAKPTYEGREVVLGPRAGDYYLVKSGLTEGERVVTRGSFKIDSALQIQARPSMMMPEGGGAAGAHHHGGQMPRQAAPAAPPPAPKRVATLAAFQGELDSLLEAYLTAQSALAGDNMEEAVQAAHVLRQTLDRIETKQLGDEARAVWMKEAPSLQKAVEQMGQSRDIGTLRAGFALLSEGLLVVLKTFGVGSAGPVYGLRCPMAFDGRGAMWLQKDRETRNPYLGAAMPRCGEVVVTISEDNSHGRGGHEHE